MRALVRAGFLPADHGLPAERVYEFCSGPYIPFQQEEFTFTPEFVGHTLQKMLDIHGEFGDVIRLLNMPPSYVILDRVVWGMSALFGKLGARARWGDLLNEYLHGAAPATDLGRAEIEWRARRAEIAAPRPCDRRYVLAPGANRHRCRDRPDGAAGRSRRWPGSAVVVVARKHAFGPRYRTEERLALVTDDGVRLAGARLPGPPDAVATIVLAHGFVHSSRTPRIHAFAHLLARRAHVDRPRPAGPRLVGRGVHPGPGGAPRRGRGGGRGRPVAAGGHRRDQPGGGGRPPPRGHVRRDRGRGRHQPAGVVGRLGHARHQAGRPLGLLARRAARCWPGCCRPASP